jgi:hypothetical protein
MDKTTIALIGLLAALFIGQVFINENFYNFYADDASGNITLSLSDLMTLIGTTSSVKSLDTSDDYPDYTQTRSNKDAAYYREYKNMRDDIKRDIRKVVKDELVRKEFTDGSDVMDDSCLDSLSAQQGADFMKYIPGKNPDDYIRKDSVPCYGCSIPT